MAVYERSYRPYAGRITPEWSRFLALPRYAFQNIFSSKLFLAFYVAAFIPSLVFMILIYTNYNAKFLELAGFQLGEVFTVNSAFFMVLQGIQLFFSALLVFFVAPALISPDLNHNALALYLSRPFNRTEYVLGKMSVLVILISAFSWVPTLLLYAFQAYLGGWEWTREHLYLPLAILLGWAAWITTAGLVALAISALFKIKLAARIFMFVASVVLGAFGAILAEGMGLWWGHNLNVYQMTGVVFAALHRLPTPVGTPVWSAWVSLALACGIALLVLRRKIRAYEIVR